ncbi:MAG: DUF3187 family protein [Pseudomonadota bacterium]
MGPIASLVAVAGPAAVEPARPGLGVCLSIASHASREITTNESYLFDGESTRLQIGGLWALGEHWRVGGQVPWVSWGEGRLDAVIDTWHDLFGFPDGIRDDVPRGQLNLIYANPQEGASGALTAGTAGVGDAQFTVARSVFERGDRSFWVSLRGELPTGAQDRLTGNGGLDLALTGHWHDDRAFASERLVASAYGGVARVGGATALGADLQPWVALGGGSLDVRFSSRVRLGLGVDLRGAVIDTQIDDLGGAAASVHVGLEVRAGPQHAVSFGFSEDLLVGTHPDVVFRLNWVRRARTDAR